MSSSKVYLVGAGPGDVELLTLKAYRLIQDADVIVYDRLVSGDIMKLVGSSAKLHYVGKQESEHTLPQEEINLLLVSLAKKYKKVVRLKGGDPFIFGRGGEEIQELLKNNIKFEVVPGISSSVASLTYAGIPITHRGVSNNFLVMTGHTCSHNGLDEVNWSSLKDVGTIVILMGIKNKKIIAQNLINSGKCKTTPVAFIENATTANQRVITSTLVEVMTSEIPVKSPSVFVIGEVVNFHAEWNWFGLSGDSTDSQERFEVSIGL